MFRLSKMIDKMSCVVGSLDGCLMIPLIVLIAYATCKRYFFNNMPSWGYDVPIFLYGIHFMLGGAYTHYGNKHVNVDILTKYVSPKVQIFLRVLSELVIASCCLAVFVYSSGWAWESTLINEKSVHQTQFNPSIWWFKWLVPVSFLFTGLQAISNIVKVFATDKNSIRVQ